MSQPGLSKWTNPDRLLMGLVLLLAIAAGWESAQRGVTRYYIYREDIAQSPQAILDASANAATHPDVHEARGLALHQLGAYQDAASELSEAVLLRGHDYRLWIYRARARNALGDVEGAESDYRASIDYAPHYAAPQNELGHLLLRMDRTDEAFKYLSRAASIDETRWPELLELARRAYPADVPAILRAVNPLNKKTKEQTALFLSGHYPESGELASFVASSLDEDGSVKLVRELIERKKFHAAYRIWKQRFHNDVAGGEASNLVIDGDFEKFSGENLGGFGWRAAHVPSSISVAVKTEGGFSGSRCLEIRFNNELETGDPIVDQLVAVSPGTRYKLIFVTRAEGLVSAGMPVVSVIDAETLELIAESGPLGLSTTGWQQSEIDFTAPPRTTGIIIGVRRARCQSSPCPIFGQLQLDNFALSPRRGE